MGQARSPEVEFINGGDTAPLMRVGYMSPQHGVSFECASCDFYRRRGDWYGDCANRKVMRKVESAGCCNEYQRNGVHG